MRAPWQAFGESSGQKHRRFQINGELAPPQGQIEPVDRIALENRRVVDEQIEPTQRGDGSRDQPLGAGGIGEVGFDQACLAPRRGDLPRHILGGGLGGMVMQRHGKAIARQS